MSEFNYSFPVFQILDETGDLKFLYFYNTNIIPQIGDTIVNMIENEENKFIRRVYFKIKDRLLCTTLGDTGNVNEFNKQPIALHVEMLIDEPVLNGEFYNE